MFNIFDSVADGGLDCQYLTAPWLPAAVPSPDGPDQCYSTFVFGVMTAIDLSVLYGDDVKIVAMQGNFWLKPEFTPADACFPDQLQQLQTEWNNAFIMARGGLYKRRVTAATPFVVGHPMNRLDWSDAGWIKQFEKAWPAPAPSSTATTYGEGQFLGLCNYVSRDSYNVPAISSGSAPLYNVPAINTNCSPTVVENEDCYEGPSLTHYRGPGWKKVNISSRRTIHMHEEDQLYWAIDWSTLQPQPTEGVCGQQFPRPIPCGMRIIPSLKIKVQYG